MPAQQPIVIHGKGTRDAVTWICALSLMGFLLIAIMNADRSNGVSLLVAGGLAAFFGAMLLYITTLRVELDGDEISYQHFFKRRRSLRLDQIRSVRGIVRSGKGGAHTYLVIQPVDPGVLP